jgi:hypothetical protein
LAILLTQALTGAAAFGTAAPPGGPPQSATSAGFISIVTTQAVTNAGGTVSGSANGATAAVTVPGGATTNGANVEISTGIPDTINAAPGNTVVADFSVALVDQSSGLKMAGPFTPPISLTITDPSILATDTVVMVTAPGQTTTVSGATVAAGTATVTFTNDPNFAVISSAATATTPTTTPASPASPGSPASPSAATPAISGATSVVTGKPFLGEGLLASLLVLSGLVVFGTIVWRRRRRVA